ncbi:phosphomannomutase/phosphoglucomutase [Candidatus Beckwithbacteria bacterium]|nr:phosphomannomutase/phosphoglucomutase [Candidatus Beckwithbacteria bacterium]
MPKNNVPSHIFRGYDIRAIAETELTDENVQLIMKAYATFLYRRQIRRVTIGHDNRLSGPRIHATAIKQLVDCGFEVIDIGLTLSQIIYFSSYHYLSKAGIMVTASHNPKEYNGFKLGVGYSDTLIGEEVQEIRRLAQEEEFEDWDQKGSVRQDDVYPAYEKYLLNLIPVSKKYTIVVDTCNSTPGAFIPKLLRAQGHTVIEQNTKLDGNFPSGTPDPTERENLERLSEGILKAKADAGFSYDADGDRLGIVDNKGRTVWNDNLVSLFAKDVIKHLPGSPIIYNTLCSKQVDDVITAAGGKPVMWLTGHSFIKAKVKEERSPFGGELSGHFFFMDNFMGHDDGAVASLRLLSYLANTNQTLAEAVDSLPKYISSPEIKFGCPDDRKFELIANEITDEVKKLMPQASYVSIDGIRADTKTAMIIVRASQNGPYITVKFEAKEQTEYDKLKVEIKKILQRYKEIDFASGVNTDALD